MKYELKPGETFCSEQDIEKKAKLVRVITRYGEAYSLIFDQHGLEVMSAPTSDERGMLRAWHNFTAWR